MWQYYFERIRSMIFLKRNNSAKNLIKVSMILLILIEIMAVMLIDLMPVVS